MVDWVREWAGGKAKGGTQGLLFSPDFEGLLCGLKDGVRPKVFGVSLANSN